ncbi:hypothetical protein T01_16282 [Trichinella spiralis]|uniref:Uncharacterized protein n=1 Tax=Trichinella spiralis TaxID=6334 RepID=A0A0V1BZM5_TRISP|nr:hypothetical protein T01_16282 [Trichinella spiralis]
MTTPPNQPDCPNVAKGGLGTAIVMFSIQKSSKRSNDLTAKELSSSILGACLLVAHYARLLLLFVVYQQTNDCNQQESLRAPLI